MYFGSAAANAIDRTAAVHRRARADADAGSTDADSADADDRCSDHRDRCRPHHAALRTPTVLQ
jgi:hypothetical protein